MRGPRLHTRRETTVSQAELIDFAGILSEARQVQKQMLDTIKECQRIAAFYQKDASKRRKALALLRGELVRQHQAQLYRSNEGRFVVLRRQIYEHFRDEVFPDWDPSENPNGVYYEQALASAHKKPWGAGLRESTYRRRLNELADKRVTNPPLLDWKKPGYYVLARLEAGTS